MPDLYTFAVRSAKPKHYKIHKISQIKKKLKWMKRYFSEVGTLKVY